jgi:putative heme-binding domain-containing protein
VILLAVSILVLGGTPAPAEDAWVNYEGKSGPGTSKHIVLISGDEEYRSEEALPQLGKILAARHGFRCTVLFAVDPKTGQVDPNHGLNIPGLEALRDADLMVIFTRFRNLPDHQMHEIDAYLRSGRPVIGMRTATHGFKTNDPDWAHYSDSYNGEKTEWRDGFGRLVLGEKWISHHGHHKHESTRGIIPPEAQSHPILRGIKPGAIWGDTDVYGVRLPLPGDSQPLVLGQVLTGMKMDDPPVEGPKNDPMMPVAWVKSYQTPGGKQGRVFNTTMGAASDLVAEGTRRMLVNAVYWAVGLEDRIPESGANVELVGTFEPTAYGFGGFKRGVRPEDHALDADALSKAATATDAADKTDAAKQADGPSDEPRRNRLELKPGDHISIVGNTLGDRMQHDGWLETMLQSRYPRHELVTRNLAFSADTLTVRLRSAGFGSPDDWLKKTEADVIFAFFGFNESFAGEAGIEQFKQDLVEFIRHTRDQQYNGRSAPRLVLFTPTAHEQLPTPNLPSGEENNRRLALYCAAMAEVARAEQVPLIDLFNRSQEMFQRSDEPLTINGIHFTERGNRLLAKAIDRALFGARPKSGDAKQPAGDKPADSVQPADNVQRTVGAKPANSVDSADSAKPADGAKRSRRARRLEAIRQAVLDKNFYWFNRYRATDGYSSFGGRSYLKFVDDQTNREVMMRELEIVELMAANRDPAIWAAAQGREYQVDDTNTPPFIPVKTNKPGEGPNGEHIYLGGEESIQKMTLGQGLEVNLFASEEMFPELINPVQMAFDPQGRLWVATWASYPHWKPKDEMNDRLLILEDTDGDGKADVCKTFAGGLHNPTGFEFWGKGVLVAMAPDLLYLQDTDGDDRVDVRRRILHGLDSADTHHTANSFTLDQGGGLYFQEGVFHRTQVETPYGPVRNIDACVWRFEPRTSKFQRYAPYGFANPHGHVFDRWGQDIIHDGTGAVPYHGAIISGHVPYPDRHDRAPQVYNQRTRPCSGTEILSSRHFPEEFQGNLLVGNVIGMQGILRYRVDDQDSSLVGVELEPMISSSDPNFRPTDFEIGSDGALYFSDWQNPVIGHMQHNLRDPSRDGIHGRVYRITYKGRPLSHSPLVADQPIDQLLELLKHPENRVRYRVRIELSGRDTNEVVEALTRWVLAQPEGPESEHDLLEALWVHQHHNVVNLPLLKRLLGASDFRARAAATRVLCYWRDRVPEALEWLRDLAADEHPRVRLEAVRAASFFTQPEAIEIPIVAAELPTDQFLDYTRGQTMKTLTPVWQRAIDAGSPIAVKTEAGNRFLVGSLNLDQLLARERTPLIDRELLMRPSVEVALRREALTGLARSEKRGELELLLDLLHQQDTQAGAEQSVLVDLVHLLAMRNTDELARARDEIQGLATSARQSVLRQIALAALIEVDGSVEPTWKLAVQSTKTLDDLVHATPWVTNPSLRAELYPRIAPLLEGLPEALAGPETDSSGTLGRYVRVELPRSGTLTLAEVEVYSGDRNVARGGKASQINTSHGGDASRALDGNTKGDYASGGQTHTSENTSMPWWEVDLGEELPIDRIEIFNRTEGPLRRRLDGFTLTVLDANREVVFQKEGNPAPKTHVAFKLEGGGAASRIRRSAMDALTHVRGQETATFHILAGFVTGAGDAPDQKEPITFGADHLAAVRALQGIPPRYWPTEEARPLLNVLMQQVRDTPVKQRTSQSSLDVLELADRLASLLPVDEARTLRGQLRELGVRVIRIDTLPERMSYDKDLIAVAVGKPVEIVFENSDLMPHNLVITQPGALEEIGLLAESTARDPGALARNYVPESDKLLLASRLLLSRETQKLSFTAPTEPGVYPYVCTYPGHWRRMYGALYVVEDLDQYLADPEAYLESHPLAIKDALLQDRRPRTAWSYEDLAGAVEELDQGRSFGNAQQMFRVANCMGCHRLNETGQQIGPDLAQLDEKFKPLDILRELLEPSARINEKFQTWTFVTDAGKVITGLVLEETPRTVKVIENPLAKNEPIVLRKSEIDERQKSNTSIMPKGLLDKLTHEEIMDLIAYIAARGKAGHAFFQGEPGSDHHGAH